MAVKNIAPFLKHFDKRLFLKCIEFFPNTYTFLGVGSCQMTDSEIMDAIAGK